MRKDTIQLKFSVKLRYPILPTPHLSPISLLALTLALKLSQEAVVLKKSLNRELGLL